ncbi:MAG: dihydrolipoamide acetyltransferase family protein [Egibacteraceae bacterium]
MATEVPMPKMGMSMESGVLVAWHKQAGDDVAEGEVIAEISSDKIDSEVTAPASGVLGPPQVAEGEEVAVGTTLVVVGAPDEALEPGPSSAATPAAGEPGPEADAGEGRPGQVAAAPVAGQSVAGPRPSPAARKRARELGVDLASVEPAEPGRRITSSDVDRAAAAAAGPQAAADRWDADGTSVPFSGIRAVVARRMAESVRETAQVTVTRHMDASGLVGQRARLREPSGGAAGLRVTYTDLLVEGVARTLRDHPRLNATLDGDGVIRHDRVSVGVAVALDDGLIVPVIHGAETMALEEIVRVRSELVERARSGTLSVREVEGATFTITNLGGFGTDVFTPILNLPQVAILGAGRITDEVAALEGEVVIRPMMWLSLTIDHRAVDGAPAAAFLDALAGAWGLE